MSHYQRAPLGEASKVVLAAALEHHCLFRRGADGKPVGQYPSVDDLPEPAKSDIIRAIEIEEFPSAAVFTSGGPRVLYHVVAYDDGLAYPISHELGERDGRRFRLSQRVVDRARERVREGKVGFVGGVTTFAFFLVAFAALALGVYQGVTSGFGWLAFGYVLVAFATVVAWLRLVHSKRKYRNTVNAAFGILHANPKADMPRYA